MTRHKRRKTLTALERAATAEAITRLHRHLMIDLTNLTATGEDYLALARVSQELVQAVRLLTGDDPERMRSAVYTGSRQTTP